jgi:DNA-binding transcriptional ArsR family regulator
MYTALADPTRRQIIEMLATGKKLPATDIYTQFPVSKPAISQHLKVLRDTNIVTVEKKAQQRIYRINQSSISELEGWIKKITKKIDERFDRLDQVLEQVKKSS